MLSHSQVIGPNSLRRHTRGGQRLFTGPSILASCLGCVVMLVMIGCANIHLSMVAPQVPAPPSGPPPVAGQNGNVTITPQYAAIAPGQSVKFSASATNGGPIQWSVSGGGSITQSGDFVGPESVAESENITVTASLASAPQKDFATAVVAVIQPGSIVCPPATGNPQVAQYSVYLPSPGKISVEFGVTSNYGLNTWQVSPSSPSGGQAKVWVAGMLGQTAYHMRGRISLDNGATLEDADETCTTGAPPVSSPVQTNTLGSPQPGIEMWDTVIPQNVTQAVATDLQGNVIWTYAYPHAIQDSIQGVQLLPNGDILMTISYLSSLDFPPQASLINEIREIDLAGNTIRSITVDALNKKLSASPLHDAQGHPYSLKSFHHDVLPLPNGHWVLLACYAKGYSNLVGIPGNTVVLGDALIDVDSSGNPDWVWNTFDHLDINRHPMNFADWTHSNNMLYSADDHNLLLSIRHQNWIVKINFLDGQGSGNIMWRLGYQGDFALAGGTDPTDWFYAQHGMNYATANTTGVFRLTLMDNGNDRFLPDGQVRCGPAKPASAVCYSSMQLIEINEANMTATLVRHYVPPPAYFSYFGGNAEPLSNGNIEVNFASAPSGAIVEELDPSTLTPVWRATTPGAAQYHANRWASLYPGVQW